MDIVNIKDLNRYEGQDVEIKGWVYNIRNVGKIWFIIFMSISFQAISYIHEML